MINLRVSTNTISEIDKPYKPNSYNSVSPYLVVDGAQKLIDLLIQIFDAKLMHKYERPDGSKMHAEVKVDDSIIMIGNSTEQFPPNKLMTHTYVKDVDITLKKAGCIITEKASERDDDPDRRGSFQDFAENVRSIRTQTIKEQQTQ